MQRAEAGERKGRESKRDERGQKKGKKDSQGGQCEGRKKRSRVFFYSVEFYTKCAVLIQKYAVLTALVP